MTAEDLKLQQMKIDTERASAIRYIRTAMLEYEVGGIDSDELDNRIASKVGPSMNEVLLTEAIAGLMTQLQNSITLLRSYSPANGQSIVDLDESLGRIRDSLSPARQGLVLGS